MPIQNKKQLRECMLKQRKVLPKQARQQAEQRLLKQIIQSKLWQESQHIGCYLARQDELDTAAIIQHSVHVGKKISAPVTTGPSSMKFVRYQPGDICHVHPKYGVSEPSQQKEDSSSDIDLLIVPAVALDVEGHRLGYGAGYYDRFLQKHPALINRTIGIAFKCCYCDSIMPEPHDQKMAYTILA
tara:strand:+ start:572 stop:1126 length:555 start_codon:yes stop_codon:yes gene_type:complete